MRKLRVDYEGWGEQWPLGTLADNGRELLFEYSAEALRQGLELSPHQLPLQPQAHGRFAVHQQRLPGLLADALPDGWGLLLMDRLFRRQGLDVAALSPLHRLAFIGERAMGALSFHPAEPLLLATEELNLLQVARDAKCVVAGQDSVALQALALMGGSPQGDRPKVLVQYNPQTGYLSTQPQAGCEPWLVKFQAEGEHKEACAIEALYAEMARRCGLDMPDTRYFDLGLRLAAFGVRRFDREAGMRVPVHTLAGALHADFRQPGAVDYTTFLRATRLFTRDEREVRKAYERVVFNVLFHNRDDHPKNLSFRLGRDRCWRLAPCYDLTFSEGAGGEHRIDVCGEARTVTRALMLRLAKEGGVATVWAEHTLDKMAQQARGLGQCAAERAESWRVRAATMKRMLSIVAASVARCTL